MKNIELIKKLRKLPPDLDVFVKGDIDGENYYDVIDIDLDRDEEGDFVSIILDY
jgi:hypothetical protein